MEKNSMMNKSGGASKLALLRQNRSVKAQEVDIEKAIDGYAASLNTQTMLAELARSSAIVNLIIDRSGSMFGTARSIANEINEFATRQAVKPYTTMLSLTVFNESVWTQLNKMNTKQFLPISSWSCGGGTNIFDALISAITPIQKTDANHKLHLVITDGQNGYSEASQEQVQSLITSRIKSGEHVFLLYNDDQPYSAKSYAAQLGVNPNNAVNFNRNGDGIKIIFQTIEDLLDGLRTKGTVPDDWAKVITAHASNPLGIKARETKFLE